MNLLTFADLKADRGLQTISNVCTTSDDFAQYLNSATRMLMRRGDWFNLIAQAQFCTCDTCLVFPEFVGQVRAVNICRNPIPVMNHWYEFVRFGKGALTNCSSSDYTLVNRGRTPVTRAIPCDTTRYVRAYPRVQNDVGKLMRIYGLDEYGQTVMTKNSTTGIWEEGEPLTLAIPYVSTSRAYRSVTRVTKAATEGPVDLYYYDPDTDTLSDAAHYKPKEQEPSYAWFKLGGTSVCCSSGCSSGNQVDVLFKMQWYPMSDNTDISPIQNLEALKKMVAAIKFEEAFDSKASEVEIARAVKEMNLQDRDEFPSDQIPVVIAPFGTVNLASDHSIGRCI